jgi:hypothetical protein
LDRSYEMREEYSPEREARAEDRRTAQHLSEKSEERRRRAGVASADWPYHVDEEVRDQGSANGELRQGARQKDRKGGTRRLGGRADAGRSERTMV